MEKSISGSGGKIQTIIGQGGGVNIKAVGGKAWYLQAWMLIFKPVGGGSLDN